MQSIGVIGAGAWGTALAQVYAAAGRDVTLWMREPSLAEAVNRTHENAAYLPGVALSAGIKATDDLARVAAQDILLLVTPAQHLRALLQTLAPMAAGKPLVICAKGIEIATGALLSDVAAQAAPGAKIAVLTGPTFASEVARGLPAAATLAAADKSLLEALQPALATPMFRPYSTTDIAGAQVAGAVKNVIAIACGIAHGKAFGESARAALITRGAAEIARLAVAMGGRAETMVGLCGIGDLVLTCSSLQSRNFSLGVALGQGQTLGDILAMRKAVTEGIYTAEATVKLAAARGVDMPIAKAVHECLSGAISVDNAIAGLLNRPLKQEF